MNLKAKGGLIILDGRNLDNADLVIQAGRKDPHYWKNLWKSREIFYFLVWRDILGRYKQTTIGIIWSLVRPVVTVIAFTIVFGKLAKFPSDGIPYPVFVLIALMPWQFFANSLNDSSMSLVTNAQLISKVYLPRLAIPFSAVFLGLIDFLITFAILIALMLWYGLMPGWDIIFTPIFILMTFAASFGTGLWIAVFNVKYRDFGHIVPLALQVGIYISPVGFGTSIVPEKWRLLYSLNPMVGIIDGFRYTIIGGNTTTMYWPGLAVSLFIITAILVSGIWYFRKTERTFADII